MIVSSGGMGTLIWTLGQVERSQRPHCTALPVRNEYWCADAINHDPATAGNPARAWVECLPSPVVRPAMSTLIRTALAASLLGVLLALPARERQAIADPLVHRDSALDRAVREIQAGIERRKLSDKYALLQKYTGELLDRSAGTKSFSDKTGNCRLTWIERLLRNPVESLREADRFTSELHEAAARPDGLPAVLSLMA